MLEELSIQALGVIDEAVLELDPGLTVVTGETGAGKTMVVTALGLLLGARADSGSVRQGAERSRVEGRLHVAAEDRVGVRALAAGALLDDDSLIVARTVTREGRSRATAGGAAVPAALLASLASDLIAVHGQSDQQRLLQPSAQRRSLDASGGPALGDAKQRYTDAFEQLAQLDAQLHEVVTRRRERAQEADLLRFGRGEIDAVDPQPVEDSQLVEEELRLSHVDALRRAADEAKFALAGDDSAMASDDALALVSRARKALELEREHDPALARLADALTSASYALTDVAADISAYANQVETDPIRLTAIQERRAVLGALTRKYGNTLVDVLAWRDAATSRLADLDDDDHRVEALQQERERLQGIRTARGAELTQARQQAALTLQQTVTHELHGLAMPHATFEVRLEPLENPGADGCEQVVFLLSAHAGAGCRPLQRGASGGELARVMLALELCLAGESTTPTMVFDEVDAGVGGKAAVEVGRRLARLAARTQVIVVTHLPQVAAFADRHYAVVKSSDGRVTTSGVTALDDAGRRRELSRMLAGLEESEAALAHVDELVALAQLERLA